MSNKTVYKVVFHLDQGWLDQFNTWLEFADTYEDEVCEVVSVTDISDSWEPIRPDSID